jgi:hypothetical protein
VAAAAAAAGAGSGPEQQPAAGGGAVVSPFSKPTVHRQVGEKHEQAGKDAQVRGQACCTSMWLVASAALAHMQPACCVYITLLTASLAVHILPAGIEPAHGLLCTQHTLPLRPAPLLPR